MAKNGQNGQKWPKNEKVKNYNWSLVTPHDVYWPKNMLTTHHTKQKSRKMPQKLPKIIKIGKKHKNGLFSKSPQQMLEILKKIGSPNIIELKFQSLQMVNFWVEIFVLGRGDLWILGKIWELGIQRSVLRDGPQKILIL